jgi:Tol biopolymer transport system component
MSRVEAGAVPHETRPREPSRALLVVGLALALLASALPPALSAQGGTERMSVDGTGGDPDASSFAPAVSADGRYVAFASDASDLVEGDENSRTDVFVVDRVTGTTERVSRNASGDDANGSSTAPAISADGRYIAFTSGASDLVPDDSNAGVDVFVRDHLSATTERISLSAGADPEVGSFDPSISADGRYVAFASDASDLVTGDANGRTDVFVHDRDSNSTERVSLDVDGGDAGGESSGAAISADGQHVAFRSAADDLVEDDGNSFIDVFVHDRESNETERVSLDTAGADPDKASFDPAISANGRYLAFASSAGDLVEDDTNSSADIFIRDRDADTTVRASLGTGGGDPDGESFGAAISSSGRYVAFGSAASDLVAGDGNALADIFVHDREAGTTNRVSLDTDRDGPEREDPNGASSAAAISADGRYVAFQSAASDLVGDDESSFDDVFLHDFLGPPQLLLTPPSHAFGDQAVAAGPTEAFTFTVSNVGAGTLNIESIGLSGSGAGQFAIASKTCGATVVGGEGCDVNVVFDPASAGALTATLEVSTDEGDGSSVLSGVGTSPPASTGNDPAPGAGPGSQIGSGSSTQAGSGHNPGSRPRCSGRIATAVGTGRGATIKGTAGRDVIVGTPGNDRIRGGGGRDLICGRGGNDRLLGGAAGDVLRGDAGDDRLAGEGGDDILHGDSGADVLSGGGAGDELHGGGGRDRLDGGAGSDRLRGEAGADRCRDGRGPQRTC